MASDQTKTTGTPDPDGGDALEQAGTAGTLEQDGRNAESGGKQLTDDQWKEALAWKAKAEEVEELRQRLAKLETPPPPPVADGAPNEPAPGTYNYFLKAGDPVALDLEQFKFEQRAERQLMRMGLSGEDEKRLRSYVATNPGRFTDYEGAYWAMTAPEREAENKRLREELAALKRAPDPEVMKAPPTHGREVGARERAKKEYTQAEFDHELQGMTELERLKFRGRLGQDFVIK